jgi:hypothetical protein
MSMKPLSSSRSTASILSFGFASCLWLALFKACISGPSLFAQTIEIKLVNGKTGRPLANTCVNVWIGHERKDALAIPTNDQGVATVWLTMDEIALNGRDRWKDCGDFGVINPVVRYEDSIRVNASYVLCQPRRPDYSWLALSSFSTEEVLQHGIVTLNSCGKSTASPKPGEIVLYVRPLNWWERLKQ